MSFSIGIVGLPNVGKSTIFAALTKKGVDIASYPFTTVHPNVGIVTVPDKRLEGLAEIIKPEKITPTIIEFVDIAGLVRGAHKGRGLGNQFLAKIREADAILEIVRVFRGKNIEHVESSIDPERDIKIIKEELIMKDLQTLEKTLPKLEKESKRKKEETKKINLLKKIREELLAGKKILELNLTDEEKKIIKDFQFLTAKPTIYVFNIDQEKISAENQEKFKFKKISLNLKLEKEISELSPEEKKELKIESQLDQLIVNCYNILDLITFYTVAGGKEARAWTLKRGSDVLKAGAKVHSDFQKKFIKAEVISWEKLVEAGAWAKAREKGWTKTVGKEYIVKDGDVIEFKI